MQNVYFVEIPLFFFLSFQASTTQINLSKILLIKRSENKENHLMQCVEVL